ncbi:hypothetical protein SAMN05444362_102386 [Dysgonomonas macrotermitis]|uniref:Uncharacterized protein n=2 Tax=Dysgonomonas macrotermitis TaxID=1346286 RepID=A0A1M4X3I8_9BACT|nr:hypothetical protein SAMN05444362_102386 [Dysgonomonas macrotermitis]
MTICMLLSALMTLFSNSDWKKSGFFKVKDKSEYTVYLQAKTSHLLSEEDTKILIDIFSAHDWVENRKNHEATIEQYVLNSHGYHYYVHSYFITITHPDKREMRLRINSGGICKDEFLIQYPDGKPYGIFRPEGKLSVGDINQIKELFFKYNTEFNNVELIENERVEISSIFNFQNVFPSLHIPPVLLSEEESKEFIRLYNSGWSNNAYSFEGDMFMRMRVREFRDFQGVISYGGTPLYPTQIQYKESDREAIRNLIKKALDGHNGERAEMSEDLTQKMHYQYKDGMPDGIIKVCLLNGNLIYEVLYDKGILINYVRYSDNGVKVQEVFFDADNGLLNRIEYDMDGNVKDKKESVFRQFYNKLDNYEYFFDNK